VCYSLFTQGQQFIPERAALQISQNKAHSLYAVSYL